VRSLCVPERAVSSEKRGESDIIMSRRRRNLSQGGLSIVDLAKEIQVHNSRSATNACQEEMEYRVARNLSNLRKRGLDEKQLPKAMSTVCPSSTILDLSYNRIQGLSTFCIPERICVLNISHNKLRNVAGLNSLCRLRELDLSHNKIERLDGFRLPSLKILNVAENRVTFAVGLEKLESLQHLDFSNNRMVKLFHIRPLSSCLKLSELRIAGNPVNGISGIRQKIMDMNPSICVLDGAKLSRSNVPSTRSYLSLHLGFKSLLDDIGRRPEVGGNFDGDGFEEEDAFDSIFEVSEAQRVIDELRKARISKSINYTTMNSSHSSSPNQHQQSDGENSDEEIDITHHIRKLIQRKKQTLRNLQEDLESVSSFQ